LIISLAILLIGWGGRNYARTGHFIPLLADHLGSFILEGIMDANKSGNKVLTADQIQYLGISPDDPYNTYVGIRDNYWQGGIDRMVRDGPILMSRALHLIRHDPLNYIRFSLQRLHRLWFKDLWVERDETGYLNLRPLDRIRKEYGLVGKAFAAIVYLFGYGAGIAMLLFGKRILALAVPAVTVLTFHMWVHAETRYALSIHPHLLIMSVLAVVLLWQRFVRRRPAQEIKEGLLFLAPEADAPRTALQTGRG
jgi:hypothetical protein